MPKKYQTPPTQTLLLLLVNVLFNKLFLDQTHRESSFVHQVQNLKCKLLRALGDLSFICMIVCRVMNFILNMSQLAELSGSPLA